MENESRFEITFLLYYLISELYWVLKPVDLTEALDETQGYVGKEKVNGKIDCFVSMWKIVHQQGCLAVSCKIWQQKLRIIATVEHKSWFKKLSPVEKCARYRFWLCTVLKLCCKTITGS